MRKLCAVILSAVSLAGCRIRYASDAQSEHQSTLSAGYLHDPY